jgi:hypothetical protein
MTFVLAWLLLTPPVTTSASQQTAADNTRQTLQVGPDRQFSRPSQAARIARDGALVEIFAGDYRGDVAVWRQNDLSLRGIGKRPHLQADGRAAEGKAIWVIRGDRVTIENLEFSGTRVPSHNGAGIRAEGAGLTIRNCRFHDNEMGLLTNRSPNGFVVIEDSEFDHNTTDTERHGKLGHNIYVHRMRYFILRNSYIHSARIGHQVKTRAIHNEIRNNRIVDGDGASSYLLDISEGGQALVIGNEFQQSAQAPNRTAIAFAPEARKSPARHHALQVLGNRFTSEGWAATFVRNFSATPVRLEDNQLPSNRVTPLRGPGTVD